MKKPRIGPASTDYCCPLCFTPLVVVWGDGMEGHKGDKAFGGFLLCPARVGKGSGECPSPEVQGHGNGRTEQSILANAYEIILAKFCGGKLPSEPEAAEEVNENNI